MKVKYVLECYFENEPDCLSCMLSSSLGALEGKSICMALGVRPICPNEGRRKDCPLWKEGI